MTWDLCFLNPQNNRSIGIASNIYPKFWSLLTLSSGKNLVWVILITCLIPFLSPTWIGACTQHPPFLSSITDLQCYSEWKCVQLKVQLHWPVSPGARHGHATKSGLWEVIAMKLFRRELEWWSLCLCIAHTFHLGALSLISRVQNLHFFAWIPLLATGVLCATCVIGQR